MSAHFTAHPELVEGWNGWNVWKDWNQLVGADGDGALFRRVRKSIEETGACWEGTEDRRWQKPSRANRHLKNIGRRDQDGELISSRTFATNIKVKI